MDPDVALIARSIARDERAFGELFDRHSTALYRYAYSLTHDVTEAQELVQETFVTAWRRPFFATWQTQNSCGQVSRELGTCLKLLVNTGPDRSSLSLRHRANRHLRF